MPEDIEMYAGMARPWVSEQFVLAQDEEKIPQWLKPSHNLLCLSARLKSCPFNAASI
jgi:hypothetical protein